MDNKQLLRKNGFIVKLQGKEYVTHAGLLWLAHENGLKQLDVTIVSWNEAERQAVCTATATGERGTYTDIGDASPANVGRNIATACLRMASTRASSRSLRLYLGLGMTALEELPGKIDHKNNPISGAPPAPKAKDESWEKTRPAFMASISELGLHYDEVKFICSSLKRDKPSLMTQQQRNNLLIWLGKLDDEAKDKWIGQHCDALEAKKHSNV